MKIRKTIIACVSFGLAVLLLFAFTTAFFDQALLVRHGTLYRKDCPRKLVALTFDDGPSPRWTPRILKELENAGVKATFFMIGEHVEKYPEVASMVASQGHEIGNHSYNHGLMISRPWEEAKAGILMTSRIIQEVTGQEVKYFRPPKAWVSRKEKENISKLGLVTVLWDINAKDWVKFDDKYMIRYIIRHIRPGSIILLHDSGGLFAKEGASRKETVKMISTLTDKIRQQGYEFVTISGLLECGRKNE